MCAMMERDGKNLAPLEFKIYLKNTLKKTLN